MTDNTLPRVVVPFAFVTANTDNPGLKDFSPAVLPADAPEDEDGDGADAGERAGADPKVSPSSVPESAPSSQKGNGAAVTPESPEGLVGAEKGNPEKVETPTK